MQLVLESMHTRIDARKDDENVATDSMTLCDARGVGKGDYCTREKNLRRIPRIDRVKGVSDDNAEGCSAFWSTDW